MERASACLMEVEAHYIHGNFSSCKTQLRKAITILSEKCWKIRPGESADAFGTYQRETKETVDKLIEIARDL